MKRTAVALTLLALLAAPSAVGCAAPDATEEVGEEDSALRGAADALEAEVKLLAGDRADLDALRAIVEHRIDALDAKKDAAKREAKADVEGYSAAQWDRSFFRKDEIEQAIDARRSDIFDRPERRALSGAKAQKQLVKELAALVDANDAGTKDAPSDAAAYLREGYVEIAISIRLNDELGFVKQAGARLGHMLRKKFPWLGRIFRGMKRDRRADGLAGEAVNVEHTGAPSELWTKDPVASTMWHPRKAEEVTPARLYRGPWFADDAQPRLPNSTEVWKLAGFRSQKADGSHAAVDIAFGDAEIKLKFREPTREVWEDAPHARLLWAMGYETDPQYVFRDVRVEPRAFIAAHSSIGRIGIRFGNHADEVIPARPPRGVSVALHGIGKAPGAGFVVVRYKDGHEENGGAAIDSLKRATDDRALMDAMESVLVTRAYGEVSHPADRDGIGPWDYDADNHVDDREVRALAIVMNAWLGSNDLKFNNVRLDVERPKDRPARYVHTLSDVGGIPADVPWEVGIDPQGRFLHPDTNAYTVRAFDRVTTNDAKWGVARIAALSEEQIVACVATGTFTNAALAVHVEKLLARRDELVKTFGLERELGLLRPSGANRNPPPRAYAP